MLYVIAIFLLILVLANDTARDILGALIGLGFFLVSVVVVLGMIAIALLMIF